MSERDDRYPMVGPDLNMDDALAGKPHDPNSFSPLNPFGDGLAPAGCLRDPECGNLAVGWYIDPVDDRIFFRHLRSNPFSAFNSGGHYIMPGDEYWDVALEYVRAGKSIDGPCTPLRRALLEMEREAYENQQCAEAAKYEADKQAEAVRQEKERKRLLYEAEHPWERRQEEGWLTWKWRVFWMPGRGMGR